MRLKSFFFFFSDKTFIFNVKIHTRKLHISVQNVSFDKTLENFVSVLTICPVVVQTEREEVYELDGTNQ